MRSDVANYYGWMKIHVAGLSNRRFPQAISTHFHFQRRKVWLLAVHPDRGILPRVLRRVELQSLRVSIPWGNCGKRAETCRLQSTVWLGFVKFDRMTVDPDHEFLEDSANAVVISLNPNSGSSDQRSIAESLAGQLERRGFEVHILTDIEEVKSKVAQLSEGTASRLRAVVAAGGDGTVSLLANCLPPQTPIAILPLGTENLLAKHIGLTADAEKIAEVITRGRTVCLDSGRANEKLFLVMASCGFDADVVHRLHSQRKGHIRHWSYAKPIVGAIGKYRYPKIRIFADGQEKCVTGKWAFIFNVPRYAMNLPIVSDADPCDGQLDLCTFRGGNLVRGLFYLGAILLRQHRGWKYSHFQRFKRIRIESDERVPYQLDGDPGGVLPLEIEVIPGFLRVLVSADYKN